MPGTEPAVDLGAATKSPTTGAAATADDPIGTRDAPLPMPPGPGGVRNPGDIRSPSGIRNPGRTKNPAGIGDPGIGNTGGFADLISRLRSVGLGDQVDSWLGDGPNKPVDGVQITSAIGENRLADLASGAGVPTQTAASGVARALPEVISAMTPHGVVPDQAAIPSEIHRLFG
jgi:uncharacterized protein YidB (DUF937 family)